MTGYYDYVLGLIPAALIGVTAFLNLVGLSLTAALPGGALVAGAIVAHALFVRTPVAGDRRARIDRSAGESAGGARGRPVDRSRRRSPSRGASD
ncbi:hypothetical protein U4E84_13895 [Halorubrum sp. AD140]|uniref:hypothetical protein n=1 Tax=Halorubrum sp. AD140 TaxID=3050073 RepID=UPI002ACD1782|nr:hypothetical protein [Halorubrum sp. AD140]MDZ5812438.1 hypothetical protein [Halorubrum sp. AD140]